MPASSIMQLGDQFEINGRRWMVVGCSAMSWRLVAIPDGETTLGLGRTWHDDDQDEMWLPCAYVERFQYVQ